MTIAVTSFNYVANPGVFTVYGTGPGPVEVQVDNQPARAGTSNDTGWSATCNLNLAAGTHHVVVTRPGTGKVVRFQFEVLDNAPPPPPG